MSIKCIGRHTEVYVQHIPKAHATSYLKLRLPTTIRHHRNCANEMPCSSAAIWSRLRA